ncbi:hypothetical protein FSP39_006664 [Pinctada imbricata]|uniref:Uncharacterized protein n=1 Tax=Pinctada imbricata TaxID=66713 RepID=A0AA88YTJ5_PINIB|nr:hypothetical protein FSP39_006664 [Pinctada imbricata]
MFMSLPFLPIAEIEPVFQTFDNLESQKLKDLRGYLERNWLRSTTFPPETWCVFKLPTRSNNDCEGWHRRLNHSARDSTPPFYELVPLLHEEAAKLPVQRVMVLEGTLARLKRKYVRDRQGKLFQMWHKFDGEITSLQLLRQVSDIVGPVQ